MSTPGDVPPPPSFDEPKKSCMYKKIRVGLEIAIVILIIFLILHVWHSERLAGGAPAYLGGGLNNQVYTSGATMRRLGQVFSSTDQGQTSTIYNDEIKDSAKRGEKVVMYNANAVPPALLNALAGK